MLSNEEVGRRLGVSHAAVSRYRSGDRFPAIELMGKIAEVFGWSMDDQWKARQNGTYANEFTARVASGAALGTMGESPTKDQRSGQGKATPDSPGPRRQSR
jgi:transcriptional regulator with XRE-family HTH domain